MTFKSDFNYTFVWSCKYYLHWMWTDAVLPGCWTWKPHTVCKTRERCRRPSHWRGQTSSFCRSCLSSCCCDEAAAWMGLRHGPAWGQLISSTFLRLLTWCDVTLKVFTYSVWLKVGLQIEVLWLKWILSSHHLSVFWRSCTLIRYGTCEKIYSFYAIKSEKLRETSLSTCHSHVKIEVTKYSKR